MANQLMKKFILSSGKFDEEKKYWLNRLDPNMVISGFPIDKKRVSLSQYQRESIQIDFPNKVSEKIFSITKKNPQAVYIFLVTGIIYLLHRYTEHLDIVVGMPVPKKKKDAKYINHILALRNEINLEQRFIDFLVQTKNEVVQANKHPNYPIEIVMQELQLPVDDGYNPLFHVIALLEEIHDKQEMMELKADTLFSFSMGESGIRLELDYNGQLYDKCTIEMIANHLLHYFSAVTEQPNLLLNEIEILSDEEKMELIFDYNQSKKELPPERSVHEWFEKQVEKTPQSIAVVFGEKELTYQELNEKANQLAWELREKGVTENTVVGVLIERSLELVISLLATLKAGAAYVPIDPDYPEKRIAYMLENSQTFLVLTREEYKEKINANTNVLIVNEVLERQTRVENLPSDYDPKRLMYLLYTSGSTGKPKAVMVTMDSFVNLLHWYTAEFHMNEKDRMLLMAPTSFDLSQKNIYAPLITGGRLVVYYPGLYHYHTMSNTIEQQQITMMSCSPSAFYPLLDVSEETNYRKLKTLRHIFLGGEPIQMVKLRPWMKSEEYHCEIVNTYGPTECTDISSFYRLTSEDMQKATVPIGKPIYRAMLFVLDQHLRLLPKGLVGELYIGGAGVSKGYFENASLTKEKFIDTPHLPCDKVYKTGDLVRWNANGELEFIGRTDHQVKIRGYRIEVGEIEAQLQMHPSVQEVVVVDKSDERGDKFLCAYFVADQKLDIRELRNELSHQLPNYMVPSYFVQMERFPLTPNGKIDRNALPDPVKQLNTKNLEKPRNEIEKKLVEIWQEVLGLKQIGVTERFSELGGHSLQAINLVSKVYKTFKIDLPLSEVFTRETIREIAQYIQNEKANEDFVIRPAEQKEYYLATSAQKRMWFLLHMEGIDTTYNMPVAIQIDGKLDQERLRNSLHSLMQRHEILRTSFDHVENQVIQRIHPSVELPFHVEEIEENQIAKRIEEFIQPFDLKKAPLFRSVLLKVNDQRHVLLYDMHHIISDGQSQNIFLKEWISLYQGEELLPLKLQYKDFSEWQHRFLSSDRVKKQEKYWLEQFSGDIPVLQLPVDYPRPPVQSFEGSHYAFKVDEALTQQLRKLVRQSKTTMYMLLLSVYYVLLSKLSQQRDIVVGSPVMGRNYADLENVCGMFVNMIPLRNRPEDTKTFIAFLDEVKQTALNAYENQDYPFEWLVQKLELKRELDQHPLFNTVFSFENDGMKNLVVKDLRITPLTVEHNVAKFDLLLSGLEYEEELVFTLEYCRKLFKQETIKRMADYFVNILHEVVKNPNIKLQDIQMLSPEEIQQLLVKWSSKKGEYPRNKSIQECFEAQVKENPEAIALVYREQSLTYQELNERANQLAHYLRARGVGKDIPVAVSMERSLDLIVGILGILKAGGAYVPLDVSYPEERLAFMMEDAQVPWVLTQQHLLERLPQGKWKTICLDTEWDQISKENADNPPLWSKPEDLAYIIYTSGSTGKPKGVAIPHRGVVRLAKGADYVKLTSEEVFLQFSTISFDAATFEIWGSLLNGAKLVLFPQHQATLEELGNVIRQYKVTTLLMTTGLFHQMVEWRLKDLRGIRQLLAGGDVLSVRHVRKVLRELPDCVFVNVYGPTENTTFTSCYAMTDESQVGTTVSIGPPVVGTEVYILDSNLQPVPIGVAGELYVGGDGLARGYVNRPELNEERFIPHPFSEEEGARLYKTGDWVRYLPDGNLEFIGRMDNQVKIRGFRIELSEIEAVILKDPTVEEAVVLVHEDERKDKHLVAFVVSNEDETILSAKLRQLFKKWLPGYMIPSTFVKLNEMPLTSSGKVDKCCLLEQGLPRRKNQEKVEPKTLLEWRMVEIWRDVLSNSEIGVKDHFFESGGHSLKAIELAEVLRKTFDVHIPLSVLFQYPTVSELCGYLEGQLSTISHGCLVPIQQGSSKYPLFLIHAVGGGILDYVHLVKEIGEDQTVYGLQAVGYDGEESPLETVEEMVERYIDEIRKVQPKGPYYFGGWSFGGVIAFEMTRKLESLGEKVALLALFDSYPLDLLNLRFTEEQKRKEAVIMWALQVGMDIDAFSLLDSNQSVEQFMKHAQEKNLISHTMNSEGIERVLNVIAANLEATMHYRYCGGIQADIHLFVCDQSIGSTRLVNPQVWEPRTKGKTIVETVSAHHFNLLQAPQVVQLGKLLKKVLGRSI